MTTIKRRSIVSFSKWFMISVGMWTLDLPTRNNALCKVYALYSIFISFYFATFVSSICIQFTITLTTQTTDLETFKQLPFVISLLITHYVTVVIRSSKFTEIITNVVNEENLISISDDEDILNSHLEEVRFNDALSAIFFALTACTGSTLILENFWHNMEVARYNREKNVTLDRPILLHLYYFNVNKRKHETLVLAITEVALVFNTLIIFSTKVIIFTCAAFASSALKNLQIRFRRVGLRCDDALTNLKLLIVEHQGVIEFVKNLNESIRYLLLLEYLLNSLNVAAVSVQFLTYNRQMLLTPAFYFCFVLVQIFILGLTTDEIKVQSVALSDALYDSPWHDQHNKLRRILLIMIARTQRPLRLTIGPFNAMTMESALAILKASYSYVTLMKHGYQ